MTVKPQLIMQDIGGYHNSDLESSRSRIIKDGSWKHQRIIVIIPASDTIPAKVALSHWSLIFPPNNGVVRILAQGMEVGNAYSSAIESVLADPNLSQWEYILTLEHDNLVPQNGVLKLIDDLENNPEFAAISGLYWCKGYGGCAHIWGDVKDPVTNYRPQMPDPNGGLVECCGLSMGCTLYRLSMFKDEKLRRPFFKTQKENGVSTQDLYFWSDARKYGYRCAVDCSIKVGHFDLRGDFGIEDFVW